MSDKDAAREQLDNAARDLNVVIGSMLPGEAKRIDRDSFIRSVLDIARQVKAEADR